MTNSAEEVFYQKTYAFNETIRTSDSSDFVGAEADYIGIQKTSNMVVMMM
jgi:hypothetical protein